MTVQTDKQQIDNMFRSDDFVYDESLNVDRQILYAQDVNSGNYGQAGVSFDLKSLKSKLTCLSEARIAGTLVITSGNDAGDVLYGKPAAGFVPNYRWATEPLLAWSFGEQGIFTGISLKTSDGTQIVNNQMISLRNHLKYLSTHTRTHNEGQGADNTGIVKTEYFKHDIAPVMYQTQRWAEGRDDTWTEAVPYTVNPTDWNVLLPPDATKRVQQFRDSSYYDGQGRVFVNFDVALADIDPIFENMDFLSTNIGYDLLLHFAWGDGSNFKVLDIYGAQYNDLRRAGGGVATPRNCPLNYNMTEQQRLCWTPKIDIAKADNTIGYRSLRLYYPTVTPNAVELDKINSKLAQGWVKTIEYLTPATRVFPVGRKQYLPGVNPTGSPEAVEQFSQIIQTSCVLPQKIHVAVTPKGALYQSIYWQQGNFTATDVGGTMGVAALMAGTTTPVMYPMPFKNIMLEVDDKMYHQSIPRNALEKWWLMKENFVDKAESPIFDPLMTQGDFLADYMGWITFDTSRLQSRIVNPLAAIPIRITFDFGDESIASSCNVPNYSNGSIVNALTGPIKDNPYADFVCNNSNMQVFLGTEFDVVIIVEKLMKLKMDISKSEAAVILGVNN